MTESEADSHLFGGETTVTEEPVSGRGAAVEVGTAVDRYLILERLGSGAMGVVYSAFDPRLDRRVAVKLLRARGEGRLDALLDEARALAKLSHPNVVAVHDAGLFSDAVFITMERVEGSTLDAWRDRRAPDWRELLTVLIGAGRGLAAVHAAGTVHRDFKPKNVMVDHVGVAKVMDFGLAALVEPPSGSSDRGQPKGTPLYMAPELFLGEHGTFSSDQYAFCVVAYEALAGVHPRSGKKSLGALVDAVSRPVEPLHAPGVPASIRAAIERGMSPVVDERWPSMDALLEVLSSGLRGRRSQWVGLAAFAAVGAGLVVAATRDEPRSSCPAADVVATSLMEEVRRPEIEAALSNFDTSFGVQRAGLIIDEVEDYAQQWARADADACRAAERAVLGQEAIDATQLCLQRDRDNYLGVAAVLRSAEGVERLRAAELLGGLSNPQSCVDGSAIVRGVAPPDAGLAESVAELRRSLAGLRAENAVGRWVEVAERITPLVERARDIGYMPVLAEAQWGGASVDPSGSRGGGQSLGRGLDRARTRRSSSRVEGRGQPRRLAARPEPNRAQPAVGDAGEAADPRRL